VAWRGVWLLLQHDKWLQHDKTKTANIQYAVSKNRECMGLHQKNNTEKSV